MITISFKQTKQGEFEHTFISFKGKYQSPLIMIIREYWHDNTVTYARVMWSTKSGRGK